MSAVLHPFLDHEGPIAFVHRGGAIGAPENTEAAFARAYEMGYRYFELDVHATADGVLVGFHDHTLRRMAGERRAIADLSWDELSEVRVEGEPLPTLEELLVRFPGVRFNIDPKHDAAVRPLVALLRRVDALERVCLASFSDRRLAFLRVALGPDVCTAAGPREIARVRAAASRGRQASILADVLQVPAGAGRVALVDARFVTTAHDAGLPVHVWTVNRRDEMERLLDLGVDGLMSDDPVLLKDVLAARGLWAADTRTA